MNLIPDPNNPRLLKRVGFGGTVIDTAGRKGVADTFDHLPSNKCRVHFENTEGTVELDWDEIVEVIYDPANDPYRGISTNP